MRKQMIAIAAVASVLISSANLMAKVPDNNMDILAENYKIVLKTNDAEQMITALKAMRHATLDAHNDTPAKLKNSAPDSAEMKEYHHGLTLLVEQIDDVLTLAEQGKIEQARSAAEAFKATRATYHKKYR